MNNIKTVLATSVAIAAIAAAWLGGISIPWAVAATTAAAMGG